MTDALGAARFGIWAFALALQGYALTISSAGMRPVVIDRAAAATDRNSTHGLADQMTIPAAIDRVTTSYVCLALGTSLVLWLGGTAAVVTLPIAADERLLLIVLSAGNIAASISLVPLFDVEHRQALGSSVNLATEVVALSLLAALWRNGVLTLPVAAVLFASKWVVTCALQYLLFHFAVRRLRALFCKSDVLRLAQTAWPIVAGSLLASVPFTAGVLVVRGFHGSADAAVIGLAQQVAAGFASFAMLGHRVVRPHIAGRYGTTRTFVVKLVVFCLGYYTLLAVVVLAATAALVYWLLEPAYREVLPTSALLLPAAMLAAANWAATSYLVRFNRQRLALAAALVAALVYLSATLLLVPRYSYMGASVSSLIAAVAAGGLLAWAVRYQFSIQAA